MDILLMLCVGGGSRRDGATQGRNSMPYSKSGLGAVLSFIHSGGEFVQHSCLACHIVVEVSC
jgi:hypothetical protein